MRRLPFVDAYADRIAAIHVLEHVYEWEAAPMLTEWARVLKPGGELIVELPCMDKVLYYMTQCLQQQIPLSLSFSWWAFWGSPRYKDPAMCHRWGYTYHSLRALVERVGFESVVFSRPRYHFAERDMRLTAVKGVQ